MDSSSAVCTPGVAASRHALLRGLAHRCGQPHYCPHHLPAWLVPPVGGNDSPTCNPVIPIVWGGPPQTLSEVGGTEIQEDQRQIWE